MMENNKVTKTFAKGAAVLLISTVLVKLIGALFKIPLSSDYCLGDLGFGYFSSVYDIYIPVFTLSTSGFPVAISKIMSDYYAKGKEKEAGLSFIIFRRIMLVIGLCGFAAILLLGGFLVKVTDNTGKSIYTVFAMAPAVIFCCVSSVYRGAFESTGNMIYPAISNIIEALSKLVLGFTSAFFTVKYTGNYGYGAAAAMAGIAVGNLLCFIFLKFSHKRFNKEKFDFKNKESTEGLFKTLIIISMPIVFSSLAGSIISFIDSITVNWQLSAMMQDKFTLIADSLKGFITNDINKENLPTILYGIRSKAYTLFHLIPTFISALTLSALPVITAGFAGNEKDSVTENMNILIKFSTVIAFPMSFGFIFAGKPVMSLLYGNSSAVAGGKILMYYGVAALGAGITLALTTFLQAIEKQNIAFVNFTVGIVVKLILNIILVGIPNVNIYGSAISTAVCYLYVTFADIFCVIKYGFSIDFKNSIFKPFISAFVCGVTAFIICKLIKSNSGVLIAIFFAAIVYFLLLILLKCFKKSDFEGLPMGEKIAKLIKKV